MAFLGSPPEREDSDWVNLPDDVYEAVVADVEEVPNTFYNPDKDSDSKKTQFQWTIKVRPSELESLPELEGEKERYSDRLMYWTGSALGRHPKNKLTAAVKTIDKGFDIEVGYSDFEDFRNHMVSEPIRIILKTEDGKKFAKVAGLMPSKKGALTMKELIELDIVKTEEA